MADSGTKLIVTALIGVLAAGQAIVVQASAPTFDLGDGQVITATPSIGDTDPVGYTVTGIKYATAKRFEDSVLNYDYSYLSGAKNPTGDMCMQAKNSPPWTLTGNAGFSENCMFLDIYLPPETPGLRYRYPVFIWSWGSLFQSLVFATITMSGSVLQPSAVIESPRDNAKLLGKTAGCSESATNVELVACLKALDADTLQGFAEAMLPTVPNQAPLAPVWALSVDQKHVPGKPADLLSNASARRATTGGFSHQFLKSDASVIAYLAFGKDVPAAGLRNLIIGDGKPQLAVLKGGIIGKVVQQTLGCTSVNPATVELIANTYGMVHGASDNTLRDALFQLITDVNFGLPAIKEAMIYSATGAAKYGNIVSLISFDNDISSASPLTDRTPGLGIYFTCDLGFSIAGTMNILTAGKNDAQVTLSFREQYRQIMLYGTAVLGTNFDPAQQNYLELGQDKVWKKENFTRAVQLVQFWDRLKELKCSPPSNVPKVPSL